MQVVASPSVRKLAQERGVDIEALAKRLGRTHISREDVLGGMPPSQESSANMNNDQSYWDVDHSAYGPIRREPMSRFAQLAAANLMAAHRMIPQVTHHDSASISRIEAVRKRLKAEGQPITALAFHVKVLAHLLRLFPRFNASLAPDGTALILKDYVHIGIAVNTSYGLVVPVIRDADSLGILDISAHISDLARRARDRQLRPADMGGASMSISNLGGIGGTGFTPIVNPPEVAILGITRSTITPQWDGSTFQPVPMVPLDLSYDHRVINGAEAAQFLRRYCEVMENPDEILLGAES